MNSRVPHKAIIDIVFRSDYHSAAYRWVSSMQPENLSLFESVFKRLTTDHDDFLGDLGNKVTINKLQASRYTIPEWRNFPIKEAQMKEEAKTKDLLAKPSTTNLTYIDFTEEQRKVCRATPARTRDNDKSQINSTEQNPAYIEKWAERNMKTSYANDICSSTFKRTVKDRTITQTVLVYSKGVLSEDAARRAEKYADVCANWTRFFREMCKSLMQSNDSTAYRSGFTVVKPVSVERFVHPKLTDPAPVLSRGVLKPAESFWESEQKHSYVPMKKQEETFKAGNQHKARYSCPFDHHALTEKPTSHIRSDFQDHMATKDDHPLYFDDMKVVIPPGTAVIGNIIGVKQ